MKNIEKYCDKNVLVLGLAKSGFAAAALLQRLGANVKVNDQKPLEENVEANLLQQKGIEVICGEHPLSLLDNRVDLIVKNPGIPYTNSLVQKALEKNIPIITEVEIANDISDAEMIGVTGSNGKTTTTTLIFEMLTKSNKTPLIAGNIGTVACEVAEKASDNDVLVTELSSFQLQGTIDFKPKVSVFLNIFDAHLDYHGTREAYEQAKANILKNQTAEDIAVYNEEDERVKFYASKSKAQKLPFSTKRVLPHGIYLKNDSVFFKEEEIIKVKEIVLPGKHNLENILAAIAVAKCYDVSNEHIAAVLHSFNGVKHRLQYVTTIASRRFYNDSKATNILAAQKALASFETPIILLAGGLDRGNEFDELIPYLSNVKAIITFGQTAPKIISAAQKAGINNIKHVDNVEQAVPVAYEISEEGDTILLSPACASWDQYKTFEQRGDIFIDYVHKLEI